MNNNVYFIRDDKRYLDGYELEYDTDYNPSSTMKEIEDAYIDYKKATASMD